MKAVGKKFVGLLNLKMIKAANHSSGWLTATADLGRWVTRLSIILLVRQVGKRAMRNHLVFAL